MLNLEAHGYRIVFTVHDEAVMEVPEDFGSVEEACEIMAQGPEWAKGLPLKAEGYYCTSYRKMLGGDSFLRQHSYRSTIDSPAHPYAHEEHA